MKNLNLSKKLVGSITTGLFVLASTFNSFAAVNVTTQDTFSITNSAMGTAVIDTTDDINVVGENVTITDIDLTNIHNAHIGTLIDKQAETINTIADNIDLKLLDAMNIGSSIINTTIIQKTNENNLYNK